MHYLLLILLGIAIVLQFHCFKLKKLLQSEYQMFVRGLGILKLIQLWEGFRLKEVRYLIGKLIVERSILYFVVIAILAYFFYYH